MLFIRLITLLNKRSETKRVLQALSVNNFPTHFLRKAPQSYTKHETSAKDANQRGSVILLYAKEFSEQNCDSSPRFQHQSLAA